MGGHVNVSCTSYIQYCHAAEISGIVYYVTGCYAADGVGWGGVGGHVKVPCTSYIQYCHAEEAGSHCSFSNSFGTRVSMGLATAPRTHVTKSVLESIARSPETLTKMG